ncbi:MAG TPA: BsuPI-related putative proteinase inhibitor [Clostridia bacterium]|nr:BsuPI-related putative proteinase inhibitor [Clostridia bacterium]HQK34362.1 BsuPI-related putative proteinase inhibitor [Spirochaetales bacterium]
MDNLNKSKKIIIFSAVLVMVFSCTMVLMSAFAADSPSQMMSVSTSSTKTDTINDRPHLTWKTVKELAEGRLSYPDIRDSFYYKEIGSGLYIVSFPIEDAQGFSLIASSTSPNAAPMLVKLRCEPAALSLELNAENLGIIMDLYNNSSSYQEINKLFYNEIPVPQNAKTYGNIIYLTGRTPDEIIQDYSNMLLNNGWELTDALGMKRFYKKTINGEEIIISVLCQQEGGPQDTDILTVIRFNLEPLPAKKDDLEQDQQDVRALVEAFGKTLQKVSLSAPKDVLAINIEENYSDYVASELLQKWQSDPQSAPGRMVSSPWPDHIDILRMEMSDKNQYTVYGEVIEVTSVELTKGGAAAKRPVNIVVKKANDRCLINSVTFGEYAQRGPVVYENTRYGFCFYLPETWKGYSIVEEQWEGTNSGELIETGLQLLIRHPDWTQNNLRQDIPIMVFTIEQWNALQKGDFSVSASPISPSKLGSNSKYVFALPARYNYAFQTGFEEVEEILKGNPLWPANQSKNSTEAGETQGKGIVIKFDPHIEQDGNTLGIEPSGTMKPSPELLEEARKSKEESKRIRTGLFNTELDIKHEENRAVASISFYNISQEDLKLNFDVGCEFDFIVTDSEDDEVYSRFHDDKIGLPAISNHKLKKGEKLSFSYTWDYNDNNGNKVAPGKYSLTVKMLPMINYKRNFCPDELTAVKDIDVNYN